MFSVLRVSRFAVGVPLAASTRIVARSSLSRPVLMSASRSFVTSFPTLLADKKAAPSKAKPKKPVAKAKPKAKKAVKAKAKVVKKPKAKVVKKVVTKPKKEARPVIRADMKPPKAPGTVYSIFVRDEIASGKYAKMTSLDDAAILFKQCSAVWASLTPAEKKPYQDKIEAAREKYHQDLTKWFEVTPHAVRIEYNRRRKARGKNMLHRPVDASKPKKPMGPYIRFYTETQNNLGAKIGPKAAGESWRALSDAEKAPYYDTARKEMAAFKEQKSV